MARFILDNVIHRVPAKQMKALILLARKMIDLKDIGILSVDSDVTTIWGEVYIGCIPYMSVDHVLSKVLQEALIDGGLAQPVPVRIWSSRILGAISSRLEPDQIQTLIMKKAIALCQDVDYDVRCSMCTQLKLISKALGYIPPDYVGPKLQKNFCCLNSWSSCLTRSQLCMKQH